MPDREKVIKHIADCVNDVDGLTNVQWVLAELDILKDALVLLKAQEQKCRECGEATSKVIQELQTKLKVQEPDEDWISRKRLRDEIQYYIEEAGWGDEVNKVLGWCLEFIDDQDKVKWE